MKRRPSPCPTCGPRGLALCRCRSRLETRNRIARRSRIRPTNPARRARLYERNFGAWADRVRRMPCWWCGAPPPSDAAHTKPRGMGGAGGDRTTLLPMCRSCHMSYDGYRLGVDHDAAIRDARSLYEREGA